MSIPSLENIKTIGIIGAGIMGRGIAVAAARVGLKVILFDINEKTLKTAEEYSQSFLTKSVERGKMSEEEKNSALENISYSIKEESLVADLIIEAILENLELKQEVLSRMEKQNNSELIIASNTSTIPITKIGAGLSRPERLIGMHFFNPAPIMKLVEVISGVETLPEIAELIVNLSKKMGKTPVNVQDTPGFLVNRVARHFYLESMMVAEERVADFETIDALMESSGFRMGPFKLVDLIGIETNHEVTKSLFSSFFQDEKFRPSRLQQKKVDAGHFGRKTKKGFYNY